MSIDEDFLDRARDLFREVGFISFKRMFGGVGLYADGLIFAIGVDDELYLKVDDETRDRFAEAGARPFRYHRADQSVGVMSYWSVPETALDDPDEAAEWARLAIGASLRKAAGKPKPRARPRPGRR